jgi:hypothetical protein
MKEQLISKIRTIAESEKFKQDAFFLCGAATGHPNQDLLDACEAYLRTAESGEENKVETDRLIAELEKVIAFGGETRGSNSIEVNNEYINEILNSRDDLLNE